MSTRTSSELLPYCGGERESREVMKLLVAARST